MMAEAGGSPSGENKTKTPNSVQGGTTAREGGKDREVDLDADRCQDKDKSSTN